MQRLALICARWRYAVVGLWLALIVVLAGGVVGWGSGFTDVADLPDGESSRAYALLGQPDDPETETQAGKIVWESQGGDITSSATRGEIEEWLGELTYRSGVVDVVSPFATDGSGQISQSGATAYATVEVTDDADVESIREDIEKWAEESAGSDAAVTVGLGGQAFTEQPAAGGLTEVIGILAALVILLVVFRSVWAAILPIVTGIVGVAASLLLVMLGSHAVDLSATSITMAALIGLGVGIDYALFIVNRFRSALMDGETVTQAVVRAVDTSGRAVIFAGLTVAAALVAIVVVQLGILTGMAQAAAVTVLVTVLTAITLLPALLTILGRRVLSRSQRREPAALTQTVRGPVEGSGQLAGRDDHRLAGRWAALVLRFPGAAIAVATALIVVLALPVLSMRVGNSDASSDPEGSSGRAYADLMGPAFGDGIDASLLLVSEIPDDASRQAFDQLVTGLSDGALGVSDIAAVSAAPAAVGDVAIASVIPISSAQEQATQELVHELRDHAIPRAEAGTSLNVLVGGETATNIDIADALMGKLPLYLALVALLGFVLLVVAFRSIVVPLVGAISNLATILVALGVTTAVFQFGWGSELLGVGSEAPVMYLVPILVVGIMFGLSMDYQVFLVSRMHEEWTHTRDNERSVREGLRSTARVIITAVLIMLAVFGSFGLSGERIVATIGIGLAAGVLIDGFVVRMLLMPALLKAIGPVVWSYPRWADRITPHVSVEGAPDSPVHDLPADAPGHDSHSPKTPDDESAAMR